MNYNRFEDPKHIEWAKKVKQRDKFTCQICGAYKVYLNAHHKNSFDIFINQRFEISNGITLCAKCHDKFHNIYGHGKNTEFQFQEFVEIIKTIEEIAKKENKK